MLDPIVAIRGRFVIEPDESITIDVVSGVAETRDACLGLVGKYQDRRLANRVFALASTHAQVVLRQLNASESDAQLYCRLAGSIIYANPSLRADPAVLVSNRRGQSGLWGYTVSGDLPIVLLQIGDAAHIDLVRQLVQAHAYWRLKGLAVDLVIWNEDRAGYRQVLQEQIIGLIAAGVEKNAPARSGAIIVRPAEQISTEDRILFQSVARAIISDSRGSLADQIGGRPADLLPARLPAARAPRVQAPAAAPPRNDLMFFNGLGGFTPDGREYIITTGPGAVTPAPWVNVLANPGFGTVISESGSAYSWAENAHEFRLTPWSNDPVTDSCGEALYLRDEESGRFWSPTPLPVRSDGAYTSRHGFGYSVFEHIEDGIASELWVYVDLAAPVKWSVLKVRNRSGRPRRLSATGYVEWVLGDLRGKTTPHVVTTADPATGAVFAENAYNAEFAGRMAFFHVDDPRHSVSGDRTEFIGRNGTLGRPAAMMRSTLSGRVGGGLDPCAAIQVPFELEDGQEREIVFRLGAGTSRDEAAALLGRLEGAPAAKASLDAVWQVLEPYARCDQRGHARPGSQHAGKRLAPLPDDGVPPVGPKRGVPVRGRIRVPRSAAGRDGAGPRGAAASAPAPAAVRVAPVRGRRRPALVASAGRPGRPHALLGRLPLAAAGDLSVRARHRRHRRTRRNGSVHRRTPGQS